jgi:hypothetical protein
MFYTLTLTIQKRVDNLHPKVWTNFRSLFKTFIYQNNHDDFSVFKSLQYNMHSIRDNVYYIFVSTSPEFLESVKKEMEALIKKAEENQNDNLVHSFDFGKIIKD